MATGYIFKWEANKGSGMPMRRRRCCTYRMSRVSLLRAAAASTKCNFERLLLVCESSSRRLELLGVAVTLHCGNGNDAARAHLGVGTPSLACCRARRGARCGAHSGMLCIRWSVSLLLLLPHTRKASERRRRKRP